jgi:hypothetical protein
MKHKVILAAVAAVSLLAFASAGHAFPIAPMQAAQSSDIQQVTVWGKPFPYGYTWRLARACTRYVPVETSRGTVMRRAWVCRGRGRAVVSYRG